MGGAFRVVWGACGGGGAPHWQAGCTHPSHPSHPRTLRDEAKGAQEESQATCAAHFHRHAPPGAGPIDVTIDLEWDGGKCSRVGWGVGGGSAGIIKHLRPTAR